MKENMSFTEGKIMQPLRLFGDCEKKSVNKILL